MAHRDLGREVRGDAPFGDGVSAVRFREVEARERGDGVATTTTTTTTGWRDG